MRHISESTQFPCALPALSDLPAGAAAAPPLLLHEVLQLHPLGGLGLLGRAGPGHRRVDVVSEVVDHLGEGEGEE